MVAYLLQIDETDDEVISSIGALNTSDLSFNLYPNPAIDVLTISVAEHNPQGQISIYTTDGKSIVRSFSVNQREMKINIQDLREGIYIVKYQNGTQQQSVKLIIE